MPYTVRGYYSFDRSANSTQTATTITDDTIVEQAHGNDTDINTIVKRFGITGELPVHNRRPLVGDFTGVTDFWSAQNALIAARQGFDDLPAELRARFDNDPGQLLAFLNDSGNRQEAIDLGLINAPQPQTIVPASAVLSTQP